MGTKVKIGELIQNPAAIYLLHDYTIELNSCESTLLNESASKEERLNAASEWNKQGPRDLK